MTVGQYATWPGAAVYDWAGNQGRVYELSATEDAYVPAGMALATCFDR